MSYKIGQEIEITEDFTLETMGGRKINVNTGDIAIIDSKARIRYISGQARNAIQMPEEGIGVNGYDHMNIAKMVYKRLNNTFSLESILEDNGYKVEDILYEIEDVLIDIL